MADIAQWVEGLLSDDNQYAFQCLKHLEAESERSGAVYAYFDTFARLLESPNSYRRTRGLLLIAANARWDNHYKIDEIIDEYVSHISDIKPITARQCIKALPDIVKYKPELAEYIRTALRQASPARYKSSMQPLVRKDIADALRRIS